MAQASISFLSLVAVPAMLQLPSLGKSMSGASRMSLSSQLSLGLFDSTALGGTLGLSRQSALNFIHPRMEMMMTMLVRPCRQQCASPR